MEQNDFSLKCEKIKQQIIDLLSNNNLPPIIQYYIIKELYTQIESSYINYIKVLQPLIKSGSNFNTITS